MQKLNKSLLIFLLLLLGLFPAAIAYSAGVIDPFSHGIVASSILSMLRGKVDFQIAQFSNTPSVGFFIISLSTVTGTDPVTIEYLPIAGLFFILAALVLSRRFIPSGTGAIAVFLVLSLRWLPLTLETVWPHTFGFALYMLFVTVMTKKAGEERWATITLLWILFVGTHFYSYTVELWLIGFVATVLLVRWLRKEPKSFLSWSVLAAMVVTFLAFTKVIY